MTTDSTLLQSAHAVATARAEIDRVDDRLTELREKSRDLDELKAALASARERRAQMLEDAMIAGRKTDATTEVDKEVDKALRAIQRREDEITAVERALATLQAQREATQAVLEDASAAFHEACASRVLGEMEELLARVNKAAVVLGERLNEGRAILNRINIMTLPQEARRWFLMQKSHYGAHLDNMEGSVRVFLSGVRGYDATAADALDAELSAARKLTGVVDTTPASDAEELGIVSSDGTIHAEPEPPAPEPVTTFRCGNVNTIDSPPGMPGVRRIA